MYPFFSKQAKAPHSMCSYANTQTSYERIQAHQKNQGDVSACQTQHSFGEDFQ